MKDEIYIQRQPKHPIVSLILVDDETPLTNEQHSNLEELTRLSDVLFIFSDDLFPASRQISKNKFTSLYEGCGWIDGGENLAVSYLKSIQYGLEIFEVSIGFCIIRLSDLRTKLPDNFESKIINITSSGVSSPIFKIRRLDSTEYFEIYKKYGSGLFKRNQDIENMYCSYTSDSKIVYFKKQIMRQIVDFWRSTGKEENKYITSFTKSDPRYFLASVSKFLGIQIIDSNIEDLDIGKL